MADSGSEVFKETIGDRCVTGEIYDEGGYKITTTQKTDNDGVTSRDETSITIIYPTSAGSEISIEAETLDELAGNLQNRGGIYTR